MKEAAISPIVATILLIGVTAAAAAPIAIWLSQYYPPFRPRYAEVAVYAGLVNENIVRFHIQHVGGETLSFDVSKPTTDFIRAWARDPVRGIENEFYCWTFENPLRFRQSDWVYAEVQLAGANLEIGKTIRVTIVSMRAGSLYDGDVTLLSLDQMPGG